MFKTIIKQDKSLKEKCINENFIFKKLFINNFLKNGNKNLAERLFFDLLFKLKINNKIYKNFDIFYYSLLNLRPVLRLKSIRVSSKTYKIPYSLSEFQRKVLSVKFLLNTKKFDGNKVVEELSRVLFLTFLGIKSNNDALKVKAKLYKEIINNQIFLKLIINKK